MVRFLWNDASRRDVVLDFLEPFTRIHSVEANGRAVAWRPENDHLVIPETALRAGGENEVKVVYSAGDEALNRSEDFLYTLFVPDRHHFSLPVFDQPNLKARWRLTLELPEGWIAVGNEAEQSATVLDDGDGAAPRHVFSFAETRPISPYLFAFAAGRFQVEESQKDGRRMRMFHRETDAARIARNRDEIFELHHSALAWLEDYTGIPYPFDKFDFVLVPSFPVRRHGAPGRHPVSTGRHPARRICHPGRLPGPRQHHRPRNIPHVVRRPRDDELVRRCLDQGGVCQPHGRQDRSPLVPPGGP